MCIPKYVDSSIRCTIVYILKIYLNVVLRLIPIKLFPLITSSISILLCHQNGHAVL